MREREKGEAGSWVRSALFQPSARVEPSRDTLRRAICPFRSSKAGAIILHLPYYERHGRGKRVHAEAQRSERRKGVVYLLFITNHLYGLNLLRRGKLLYQQPLSAPSRLRANPSGATYRHHHPS